MTILCLRNWNLSFKLVAWLLVVKLLPNTLCPHLVFSLVILEGALNTEEMHSQSEKSFKVHALLCYSFHSNNMKLKLKLLFQVKEQQSVVPLYLCYCCTVDSFRAQQVKPGCYLEIG